MRRPAVVRAWSLAEGDVLMSGKQVISVQRDPLNGWVSVAVDHGSRRELGHADRIVVIRRATNDAVERSGRRARLVRRGGKPKQDDLG